MSRNIKLVDFIIINNYRILFFSWLLVQACLFIVYGVYVEGESEKYISQAKILLSTGSLGTYNFWLYFTEIFLISIALKFSLGYSFVVITQVLLNGFATIMLYKLAHQVLNSKFLATVATFFFIVCTPLQTYNYYLFTESCFYSLTIIFSSYLINLKQLSIKSIIVLLLLAGLLSITRPTGILFQPAALIYIFLNFFKHISLKIKLLTIGVGICMFFFLLDIMMQSGGELNFMLPFRNESIICGVPTIAEIPIKTIDHGNSPEGIIYYITHNSQQFVRLGWFKTVAFFGLTRSYYSTLHNLYLIIFYYPFYLFCIVFLARNYNKMNPMHVYLLLIILLFWLTTVFTCDDWHNRFFLTITPCIFILGLSAFKEKKINL